MSASHNAPIVDLKKLISLSDSKIAVITTEWNFEITNALHAACIQLLKKKKIKDKNLFQYSVPGSFELPAAAKMVIENRKVDAVICLGCVIKGQTSHFEFISTAVTNGIMDLNLRYNVPVILGVITPHNLEQAKDRAGGKVGNKGTEAAIAAIKMIELKNKIIR